MAKSKAIAAGSFVESLFHVGIYKRTQGRVVRQVTCAVMWLVTLIAAWRLFQSLQVAASNPLLKYVPPLVLLVVGVWLSYRAVNFSRFADFLIAVEAEMNKVSWPSKPELIRSSMVVIFVIFFLAAVLFFYDMLWQFLFSWIGIRPK